MPPKGIAPVRSQRYSVVCDNMKVRKQAAKDELKALRGMKKREDKRHKNLMKRAKALECRDLVELAGIRNMTMGQMMAFCDEMGVRRDDVPPNSGSGPSGVHPADPGPADDHAVPQPPAEAPVMSD